LPERNLQNLLRTPRLLKAKVVRIRELLSHREGLLA